jgi:hypothetical protein
VKLINKFCTGCNQDKPIEDYYKNKSMKDSMDVICKICRSSYNNKNNIKYHPESNPKENAKNMYVNGKYVPRSHPLYKAGNFKTFEGAAFSSLKGYTKTTEGYVYIINNPCWNGWIKVGMAIDAKDRCNQYQTSSPHRDYKLCYSKFFDDRSNAEKKAHTLLKKEAEDSKGEWFKIKQDKAKEIIETL